MGKGLPEIFADVDAVLFDLDGTLVETNIDFTSMKREMIDLAERYGVPQDDLLGRDILAIIDRLCEILVSNGHESPESARNEALSILREIEMKHSSDAAEIKPARKVIDALRERGIKVGIVTRNCREASVDSLDRTGIHADLLLSRDDVTRTKPSPDHITEALALLGATPERSVMVGDHIMDITAGKAAGTATVAILTPDRPPDFFDSVGPDAVAADLHEILSALISSNS